MPEFAADLALIVRATRAAGELAMRTFRKSPEHWEKSPGNPVSEADIAVDAYLKQCLLGSRPGYGWLSEETADDPRRLGCSKVWIIDPIDGTRDFIRGRTGWCVSVALVDDGVAVLGALAAPARQEFCVASRGRGAQCNGVRLTVSGRQQLAGLTMPVDPPSLKSPFWPEPWDAVAHEKPNSLALRIAHVAAGRCDAFIEGRQIAEWDVAAAALICTEAGGSVTDRHGATLIFNQATPSVAGLVAATPVLHGEVARRLNAGVAALSARRR